ncbi:NTP transferase domain-containing protein [Chitinophaga sp. SYP-B3965]|uniref:NTP transferase domain-containing protein n=1 Tax=Chitinophaga sp. SYP-B3965 TaxID=2663120 RepID=UPI0012999E17|nr:NTP transferase domain-containing protein [Chitinophaga sp. SYP-B3965]MRG45859.1 NTP transferase domain-containing protein [Chitinophaga sp. SYP-B3965]
MTSDNNLKGLILCGGLSTRMQQDKSQIAYHGKPQWQYLHDLLKSFLPEVYLSCRPEQEFPGCDNLIPDSVIGAGPSSGLLSAHAAYPDASWLVLACDLPLISEQSISYLLSNRNPQKAATAFVSPFNFSPEPLITIWEPKGLDALELEFREGKNCPRKTLLKVEVEILKNPNDTEQFNANTPDEMKDAMGKIN